MDAFVKAAHRIAQRSQDPSTKVGCVIVGESTVAAAWNRFPEGIPEEWWSDRTLKYQAVVHAEVAALMTAGSAAVGATMYVTHHPCGACAPIIAEAGIKRVVCPAGPWRDDPAVAASVEDAAEIFRLCGVEVINEL